MKTRKLLVALVALLVTAPAIATEGNPFGLDLDKHPTEYGCSQEQDDKYWYRCETVPKPHPEFDIYSIQYVEGVGTCIATGLGKTIENDSNGFTTKKRVDAIAKQLKPKYGVETEKYDFLSAGSIWEESVYWMMGILKKERFYYYGWWSDEFKPVGEVAELAVAAQAIARDKGFVLLEFYFKRQPQCDAIIEKAGQDAF